MTDLRPLLRVYRIQITWRIQNTMEDLWTLYMECILSLAHLIRVREPVWSALVLGCLELGLDHASWKAGFARPASLEGAGETRVWTHKLEAERSTSTAPAVRQAH